MIPAIADTSNVESEPSIRERAIDAARQVAHVSHEARRLKSLAADVAEDGLYAAKRAAKSAQRRIDDLKDEAAYRVKREPFKAIGLAAGVGLVLGMAVGWIGGRFGNAKSICNG